MHTNLGHSEQSAASPAVLFFTSRVFVCFWLLFWVGVGRVGEASFSSSSFVVVVVVVVTWTMQMWALVGRSIK